MRIVVQLAVLLASFFLGEINGLPRKNNEELEAAPYSTLRKTNDYEERLYPASKWVKTQAKLCSRDDVEFPFMFWKLFNYISGSGNDRKVTIPMTAPVSLLIGPKMSDTDCFRTFTMAFYIPSAFQNDPPQPTDPQVSIEERPELSVLTRTFDGFANDSAIKVEHDKLWFSLSEEDKKTVDKDGSYYFSGYDAPFQLINRRNEIWLLKNQPSDTDKAEIIKNLRPVISTVAVDSLIDYVMARKTFHLKKFLMNLGRAGII